MSDPVITHPGQVPTPGNPDQSPLGPSVNESDAKVAKAVEAAGGRGTRCHISKPL